MQIIVIIIILPVAVAVAVAVAVTIIPMGCSILAVPRVLHLLVQLIASGHGIV